MSETIQIIEAIELQAKKAGAVAGVERIIAGDNVTVDNTDPTKPIVSSTGGGGGGTKCTGAEINTGTDDVKYATPKAIADSNVFRAEKCGQINALTAKTTPVDADLVMIDDSAAFNAKKKVTWQNVKATLKTYFDTLYSNLALGETSSTAYRGDRGKTAYDHSQTTHAPSNADQTTATNVGSSIHGSTAKTTPVDADTVAMIDSEASNVLKKTTWQNVKATLKTYFDTLYSNLALGETSSTAYRGDRGKTAYDHSQTTHAPSNADQTTATNVGSSIHGSTAKTTPVDADTVAIIDSAASNVLKKTTWQNVKATLKTYFDTLYSNLALGETSSTAYRGDRGKTAYDHSQTTHAPSNAVSLATVKADTDIADAISKKHDHSNKTAIDKINESAGNPTWNGGAWPGGSGGGDMVLASVQSVTGLKTFDKDKIAMKGTGTGKTIISTQNTSETDYTATLPIGNGTFAYVEHMVTMFGVHPGRTVTTSASLSSDDFNTIVFVNSSSNITLTIPNSIWVDGEESTQNIYICSLNLGIVSIEVADSPNQILYPSNPAQIHQRYNVVTLKCLVVPGMGIAGVYALYGNTHTKASEGEIRTGENDSKFTTAKGLKDAYITPEKIEISNGGYETTEIDSTDYWGKRTYFTNTANINVTLNDGVSTAAAVGTRFQIEQRSTGKVTLVGEVDVVFYGISETVGQYSVIEFVKISNDEDGVWVGTLLSSPVKASSSDINTGTDDSKYVTSKAIADSDLVKKFVGINPQTGTTYTLALADAGKLVRCSNANSITLTIPKNSVVAFATGTRIQVEQQAAGVVTVAPVDGDVTINSSAKKTWGQYSVIELVKLDTNTWNVVGGSV